MRQEVKIVKTFEVPYRFLTILLVISLWFASLPFVAWPHGGGLDGYGCHNDRKHGGYHCHRGQFAQKAFASKFEMLKADERHASSKSKQQTTTVPFPLHSTLGHERAENSELLDINTATLGQMKVLPGIGDAHSEKIIKGRPYKRKDELVQKKLIPQATYDKIKDKIVAKEK
jgi:DNA uptake protein ComE-like DNA-binding protein